MSVHSHCITGINYLRIVLTATFQAYLEHARSPSDFFLHLFWKRVFRDKSHRVSTGRTTFLHPINSVKTLKKNTKHWPQPLAWPHPFFVHHQTPDRRGIALFTLYLQRWKLILELLCILNQTKTVQPVATCVDHAHHSQPATPTAAASHAHCGHRHISGTDTLWRHGQLVKLIVV